MPSFASHGSMDGPGSGLQATARAPTLAGYVTGRLKPLCVAAGLARQADDITRTLADLMEPWGGRDLGQRSSFVSEISDDNTPVEFSVALADERADGAEVADVRVLFEPQGDEPTLRAYRAAGLALHERLERELGADLRRFRLVQDLFLPEDMQGRFAVWSSAVFSAVEAPSYKTYFNPQARGRERSEALVQRALSRLGLGGAWSALARTGLRRGAGVDELKYFGLDLTSTGHARVKVYVHHHGATPDDLEVACSAADGYVAGEALEFVRAMRGGDERLQDRAPFTCASFVGEDSARPASVTVYVPVCAYARDDSVVRRRVHDYLVEKGSGARLYGALLDAFANRALDAGVGMQSWVALRRHAGVARVTVYLATEAYRVYAPGVVPAPTQRVPPAAGEVSIVNR